MWSPLAGSKAIHQVFGGKRSITGDVSTGTAAMKFVCSVLGVLLLHEDRRYSLANITTEDQLIVKFQSECYSVLHAWFTTVCQLQSTGTVISNRLSINV